MSSTLPPKTTKHRNCRRCTTSGKSEANTRIFFNKKHQVKRNVCHHHNSTLMTAKYSEASPSETGCLDGLVGISGTESSHQTNNIHHSLLTPIYQLRNIEEMRDN